MANQAARAWQSVLQQLEGMRTKSDSHAANDALKQTLARLEDMPQQPKSAWKRLLDLKVPHKLASLWRQHGTTTTILPTSISGSSATEISLQMRDTDCCNPAVDAALALLNTARRDGFFSLSGHLGSLTASLQQQLTQSGLLQLLADAMQTTACELHEQDAALDGWYSCNAAGERAAQLMKLRYTASRLISAQMFICWMWMPGQLVSPDACAGTAAAAMQLGVAAVQHISTCLRLLEEQGQQPDADLSRFATDLGQHMQFLSPLLAETIQRLPPAQATHWTPAPVYLQWSTISTVISMYADLQLSGQGLAGDQGNSAVATVISGSSDNSSGSNRSQSHSSSTASSSRRQSQATAAAALLQSQLLPDSHAELLQLFGCSTHAAVWLAAKFRSDMPATNLTACFSTLACLQSAPGQFVPLDTSPMLVIPPDWRTNTPEENAELLLQHQQDVLGGVEHRVAQLLPLVIMYWAAQQQPGSEAFEEAHFLIAIGASSAVLNTLLQQQWLHTLQQHVHAVPSNAALPASWLYQLLGLWLNAWQHSTQHWQQRRTSQASAQLPADVAAALPLAEEERMIVLLCSVAQLPEFAKDASHNQARVEADKQAGAETATSSGSGSSANGSECTGGGAGAGSGTSTAAPDTAAEWDMCAQLAKPLCSALQAFFRRNPGSESACAVPASDCTRYNKPAAHVQLLLGLLRRMQAAADSAAAQAQLAGLIVSLLKLCAGKEAPADARELVWYGCIVETVNRLQQVSANLSAASSDTSSSSSSSSRTDSDAAEGILAPDGNRAAVLATGSTAALVASAALWLHVLGRCCLLWVQHMDQHVLSSMSNSDREALLPVVQKIQAGVRPLASTCKSLAGCLFDDANSLLGARLAAAGYIMQPVQDGLTAVQEACSSFSSTEDKLDGARQLTAATLSLALALCSLPVCSCCNNPTCSNSSGTSERRLVSGRSCVCSGCRTARYCSHQCQKQHWKQQHKPACKALAAAAAAAAAAVTAAASAAAGEEVEAAAPTP